MPGGGRGGTGGSGGGGGSSSAAVDERRLRPVFDLIDDMNYKQAVSAVDKILKKFPDFVQAKAVRVLTLWRCGRHVEASNAVDHVISLRPSDEATLSLLSMSLREMRREEDIIMLYSAAVEKRPKDEELLSSLFCSHVRAGDLHGMQTRAAQLNKACPNKPYFYWSVMSLFLNGVSSTSDVPANPGIQLTLARRMLEKSIQETAMGLKPEQLQLYLIVLLQMKEFPEALKILDKHEDILGTGFLVGYAKKRIECLLGLDRFDEVREICTEAISSQSEPDYLYFYILISIAFKGKLKSSNSNIDSIDNLTKYIERKLSIKNDENDVDEDTLQSVATFLVSQRDANPQSMGHELSVLQLSSGIMCLALNPPDFGAPSLAECIVSVFDKFGQKPSFYSYVRDSLPQLPAEENLKSLTERIDQHIEQEPSMHTVYRIQGLLGIERALRGPCVGLETTLAKVESLRCLHDRFLPIGKHLEVTEPQPASLFVAMAVHYMLDCYSTAPDKTKRQQYLWRCVEMLEEARSCSPTDAQLLLLLLRIYAILGVYQPCTIIYDQMKTRQFLHHTLGYLLTSGPGTLLHLGAMAESDALYIGIHKYFETSLTTVPDYIVSAFRNGSFEQIPDLMAWSKSLESSFPFHQAMTEKLIADCTRETGCHNRTINQVHLIADFPKDRDLTELDNLEDHRDLDVLYSWSVRNRTDAAQHLDKKTSFAHEVAWLKVRINGIRAFVTLLKLIQPTSDKAEDNSPNERLEFVTGFSDAFKESWERVKTCNDLQRTMEFYSEQHPLNAPLSPMAAYFHLDLNLILSSMLTAVIEVYRQLEASEAQPNINTISDRMCQVVEQFKASLAKLPKQMICEDEFIDVESVRHLHLVIESYAMCAFAFDILEQTVIKSKRVDKKRNADFFKSFKSIVEQFVGVGQSLENHVKTLQETVESMKHCAFLKCEKSSLTTLNPLIIQSYNSSLHQLSTFAHDKVQYFKCFNF